MACNWLLWTLEIFIFPAVVALASIFFFVLLQLFSTGSLNSLERQFRNFFSTLFYTFWSSDIIFLVQKIFFEHKIIWISRFFGTWNCRFLAHTQDVWNYMKFFPLSSRFRLYIFYFLYFFLLWTRKNIFFSLLFFFCYPVHEIYVLTIQKIFYEWTSDSTSTDACVEFCSEHFSHRRRRSENVECGILMSFTLIFAVFGWNFYIVLKFE